MDKKYTYITNSIYNNFIEFYDYRFKQYKLNKRINKTPFMDTYGENKLITSQFLHFDKILLVILRPILNPLTEKTLLRYSICLYQEDDRISPEFVLGNLSSTKEVSVEYERLEIVVKWLLQNASNLKQYFEEMKEKNVDEYLNIITRQHFIFGIPLDGLEQYLNKEYGVDKDPYGQYDQFGGRQHNSNYKRTKKRIQLPRNNRASVVYIDSKDNEYVKLRGKFVNLCLD